MPGNNPQSQNRSNASKDAKVPVDLPNELSREQIDALKREEDRKIAEFRRTHGDAFSKDDIHKLMENARPSQPKLPPTPS